MLELLPFASEEIQSVAMESLKLGKVAMMVTLWQLMAVVPLALLKLVMFVQVTLEGNHFA